MDHPWGFQSAASLQGTPLPQKPQLPTRNEQLLIVKMGHLGVLTNSEIKSRKLSLKATIYHIRKRCMGERQKLLKK